MDKISNAFKNKKANIGYVVGGYPSLEATADVLDRLDDSVLDLLEIGVPYSDPLADGKLIADASFRTALHGTNIDDIFKLLKSKEFNKPVIFLVYFNLVFSYGVENFIKHAKESGISGMIVPDLPLEESMQVREISKKYNFALVPLVSVTSGDRVEQLIKDADGFIYALGAIGVSGSKRASEERIKELVGRVKKMSSLPVAVGFGIKNSNDVKTVKSYADGAIIGTAIVELTAKFSGDELIDEIAKLY